MMSFLKKLGQFLANAVAVAVGIGPILKPFLGSSKAGQIVFTGINDFTAIGQRILEIETAIQTPGSGAQKLQAAIPLVSNIVRTSELVSGKKIHDELMFSKGVTEVTQGVVDILNALDESNVKTA